MYSFCAIYSLRMSFCSVPEIFFQSAPCFSATAKYMAQITAAGELMVIEVVTLPSGILSKSTSMSANELMATPHRRVNPARVRRLARIAEVAVRIPSRKISGRVQALNGKAGNRGEFRLALGIFLKRGPQRIFFPSFFFRGRLAA